METFTFLGGIVIQFAVIGAIRLIYVGRFIEAYNKLDRAYACEIVKAPTTIEQWLTGPAFVFSVIQSLALLGVLTLFAPGYLKARKC